MYRQALSTLGFLLISAAPSVVAAATEVCVTCSGPSATYRCTVDDAEKVERYRHSKRALQLVCITELAKEGGHEKCSVGRSGKDGCFGLPRSVSISNSLDALAAPPIADADPGPQDSIAVEEEVSELPEKAGPPKTMEELARRTASGSGFGKAVKKSWGCLASLFRDC